jgi:DNA-binding transcriptional regulator/RsmH inhibitor MraZ
MEALKDIEIRPLQLKADNKTRLQIPALVRRMIKAGPGTRFFLYVTKEGDLYFSKSEK